MNFRAKGIKLRVPKFDFEKDYELSRGMKDSLEQNRGLLDTPRGLKELTGDLKISGGPLLSLNFGAGVAKGLAAGVSTTGFIEHVTPSAFDLLSTSPMLSSLLIFVGLAVHFACDGASSNGGKWSPERRINWAEDKLQRILNWRSFGGIEGFENGFEIQEIKERARDMEKTFAGSKQEPIDLTEALFGIELSFAPSTFRKILNMYAEINRERIFNAYGVESKLHKIYTMVYNVDGWVKQDLYEMAYYIETAMIITLKKIVDQWKNQDEVSRSFELEKWSELARKLQGYLDTIDRLVNPTDH